MEFMVIRCRFVPTLSTMISMTAAPVSKLAQLRRRRSGHGVALDINSDYVGRRPSGDPRLDLATIDRA